MLPYNLLANGLAIIHPKTGNQENAFSYSAHGQIRTHSQVSRANAYTNHGMELLTCQMERLSTGSNDKMDLLSTKSDAGDDSSVTLDSRSELYYTGSNDEMDCTN